MEKQHNNESLDIKEKISNNETTGSGLSEAERNLQDSVNTNIDPHQGDGAETLVDTYNINDKAHSDSSLDDFIKTTSNFNHADNPEDDKENDSMH